MIAIFNTNPYNCISDTFSRRNSPPAEAVGSRKMYYEARDRAGLFCQNGRPVCKWTKRVCTLLFLIGLIATFHRSYSTPHPLLLQAWRVQPLFQTSSNTEFGNSHMINDENASSASFHSHNSPIRMSSNISSASSPQQAQEKRVALCLVGGARAFELTGPTIKKYILDVFDRAYVFLHAPLDENSYKFHLLKGQRRLATLRIFKPDWISETKISKELLSSAGSPNGSQGLLQYFRLVEGCWDMITQYEKTHHFKFQWIIRTRVDGYWNRPLPGLQHFTEGYYYVPYGSQYGGLNDRLGIGDRHTSQIALARMSLLSTIHSQGYRHLNSESAFKAQLTSAKIQIKLENFPFCVLSFRKYKWPLNGIMDVPVASISSQGPLNGAKCRPCTPKLTGHRARAAAEALHRSWSWTGPGPADGLELCDARRDWELGWEDLFDKAAGKESAFIRRASSNQTRPECIQQLSSFREQWDVWNAPSPEIICMEKYGKRKLPVAGI